MTRLLITLLALAFSTAGITTAHAYKPSRDLLNKKGYSPMTVDVVQAQSKRQEWLEPPPRKRSPWMQIERNIYINDWVGNMDPFGYYIIRERQ